MLALRRNDLDPQLRDDFRWPREHFLRVLKVEDDLGKQRLFYYHLREAFGHMIAGLARVRIGPGGFA